MTYQNALKAASKVGAAHAKGLPHLAQTINVLSHVHAINPQCTYDGAVKKNLTGNQVRKMNSQQLSDLMFEGMGI